MDEKKQPLALIVTDDGLGQRLDKWLSTHASIPRSQIAKLIAEGLILANDKPARASLSLKPGDRILIHKRAEAGAQIASIDIPIIYEDDDLLVLNKPSGLVVHSELQNPQPNLVDTLLSQGKQLSPAPKDHPKRAGVVHRLDKDTTGVIVLAKSPMVCEHLMRQFKEKTNLRLYIALLDGILPKPHIAYESYLSRDPKDRRRFCSNLEKKEIEGGKQRYAKSIFELKSVYGHRYSLVSIALKTGRTHQIRVHAKALKAAVLGDPLYRSHTQIPNHFDPEIKNCISRLTRQMLHAQELGFSHPSTGRQMHFTAPLPSDMQKLVDLLQKYALE